MLQSIKGPSWAVYVGHHIQFVTITCIILMIGRRKWFLEAIGTTGLNNLLIAFEDKSAQAVCTFAYSDGPGHEPIIFQGRTDGKIVPPRGPNNFGKSVCCQSGCCLLIAGARLGSDSRV